MDQDYFMEDGVVSPASHWSGGEQVFMEHMPHFDASLSSMIMRLGGGDGAAAFPGYATAASLFSGGGNLSPSMPHVSSDPAFAGRAAKFSCYGSQSFNGRTANDIESTRLRSPAPLMGSAKLSRVCSSPSLRQGGSPPNFMKTHMKLGRIQGIGDNSNEDSSVSDQMPSSNEMNSRKRKTKTSDDANAKRLKAAETVKNDTRPEEEEEEEEEQKANQKKPPEPPKDYIHVRARRGQATDSHSLAERVRREKISERMKLLQDLVPGCNKVTGKALMLDEIINYVQSLQRQVEFLSMKLATVNPGLDFDTQKIPQQMYPSNSSFFHQDVQQLHENRGTLGIHLPPADGFTHNLPQLPAFNEDDLHSIVQMGLAQKPSTFPSTNHSTGMKDER